MELFSENTIRRLDSLGRISIPKGLRNRYWIDPNDELEFYSLRYNGRDYICLTKAGMSVEKQKCEMVADLLDELGVKIPDEILEKLQR